MTKAAENPYPLGMDDDDDDGILSFYSLIASFLPFSPVSEI